MQQRDDCQNYRDDRPQLHRDRRRYTDDRPPVLEDSRSKYHEERVRYRDDRPRPWYQDDPPRSQERVRHTEDHARYKDDRGRHQGERTRQQDERPRYQHERSGYQDGHARHGVERRGCRDSRPRQEGGHRRCEEDQGRVTGCGDRERSRERVGRVGDRRQGDERGPGQRLRPAPLREADSRDVRGRGPERSRDRPEDGRAVHTEGPPSPRQPPAAKGPRSPSPGSQASEGKDAPAKRRQQEASIAEITGEIEGPSTKGCYRSVCEVPNLHGKQSVRTAGPWQPDQETAENDKDRLINAFTEGGAAELFRVKSELFFSSRVRK